MLNSLICLNCFALFWLREGSSLLLSWLVCPGVGGLQEGQENGVSVTSAPLPARLSTCFLQPLLEGCKG